MIMRTEQHSAICAAALSKRLSALFKQKHHQTLSNLAKAKRILNQGQN